MSGARSLTARAALALVLVFGLYILTGVVALTLMAAPILEIVWFGGCSYSCSAVPRSGLDCSSRWCQRPARWVAPGLKIERGQQPKVWAIAERVAARSEQELPDEIYLAKEFRASVLKHGGLFGIRGKHVLIVGIPLLLVTDLPQLEAVIAHEFGDFSHGDTKLGPLTLATRRTLDQAIQTARHPALKLPFELYRMLYERLTLSVSRTQKYAADHLGASVTRTSTMAQALRQVHIGQRAFVMYMTQQYRPLISDGYLLPFLEGFQLFVHQLSAEDIVGISEDKQAPEISRYDSHPPMGTRIAALGVEPSSVTFMLPATPAWTIVQARDVIEAEIVRSQVFAVEALTPIALS